MTNTRGAAALALKGTGIGAGLIALVVAAVAVALAVGGFFTMLGFGVLHSQFAAVPAIGYGRAFMTSIGLWLIFGTQFGSSRISRAS